MKWGWVDTPFLPVAIQDVIPLGEPSAAIFVIWGNYKKQAETVAM